MRTARYGALAMAVCATVTAICMSVIAGWQRGGWLAERLVWIATGAVLVFGAHLLPSLCRSAPLAVRCVGGVLWVACMAGASYGHATFFVLSQLHAGEVRARPVVVTAPPPRSLAAVMAERATVTRQLAVADAQRCSHDCPVLRVRQVSLASKLDALNAEAGEVRRQEAIADRDAARNEALRDDPVIARLATLMPLPVAHLDLLAGLAFAAVLEGVACLLWYLVAQSHPSDAPEIPAVSESVVADAPAVSASPPAVTPVTPADTEVARLVRDIEAGYLRPTVSGIRRHLRCSQARAAALRRQVLGLATHV
ncbi:hypothetical protein ADM96_19535 [Burkholderia sp. ST111]|nr:hypothetical protein ADM96_19535 [Burkholderia sp. ST111]